MVVTFDLTTLFHNPNMKVSLKWLNTYFTEPLTADEVDRAFTFHAFEIDGIEGDSIDVKVLPSRGADCLCHRGIAKELSAITNQALTQDPLRETLPEFPKNGTLSVRVEDKGKCLRYMGAYVTGVKVGPSPLWLKESLKAIGQRSINNVVDATNYVMNNIGQPLHAFDAAKLTSTDGHYTIGVRGAREGEKITTLTGDEYILTPTTLLIVDGTNDTPLGIAGVKGGRAAEVTEVTTDIIIEAANFDGTTTRRTAQALKLFTDASTRFQNRPSTELVAYGMRDVLTLITDIAGGEVMDVVDEYAARPLAAPVSVTLSEINGLLGSTFTTHASVEALTRLDLSPTIEGEKITVTPPFERTDITIPYDVIEEVGRIIGYDTIPPVDLPVLENAPDQRRYRGIERMKDELVAQGFIEVSTQSFAKKGDIQLANPLDKTKPAFRTSLEENLKDALTLAKHNAALVLEPNQKPKLFEVGTVFTKEDEHVELRMTGPVPEWGEHAPTVDNLSQANLEEYGKEYEPVHYELGMFIPFSQYPFVTRDIALWVPEDVSPETVQSCITETAGELCTRISQFDAFKKEGRVSYAFRLVFQSYDRTLTDEEVGKIMEGVSTVIGEKGWEVR